MHKYVLHGLGKNRYSLWSSHWHGHHKTCRKNNNLDKDYLESVFGESSRKEITGLIILNLFHLPFLFFMPLFNLGLIIHSVRYYHLHRKSHLDVEWGKENLPWHYDHHMGKKHDANWGVTTDWVDEYMNTRVTYNKD